ncbi:MAG: MerR family transcriptional regulator [Sphingobacteriaceae bacterium]
MNANYSVKQLAKIAGITVRTLHLYDKLGLVKPHIRTDARYRLYGEKELLRLQQVLFYKELDFPLKDIRLILDDPDFNLVAALKSHKQALKSKKNRINTLLKTIDKTIITLNNKTMLNLNELYEGLSHEEVSAYRNKAIEAYGEEVVIKSEAYLQTQSKEELKLLIAKQKSLAIELSWLKMEDPGSTTVQELVHEHYINTRKLWGTHQASDKQAATYKGLGQLYLSDERFTTINDKPDQEFARFLSLAMAFYADNRLA